MDECIRCFIRFQLKSEMTKEDGSSMVYFVTFVVDSWREGQIVIVFDAELVLR
jgi:hypothetical protein